MTSILAPDGHTRLQETALDRLVAEAHHHAWRDNAIELPDGTEPGPVNSRLKSDGETLVIYHTDRQAIAKFLFGPLQAMLLRNWAERMHEVVTKTKFIQILPQNPQKAVGNWARGDDLGKSDGRQGVSEKDA